MTENDLNNLTIRQYS